MLSMLARFNRRRDDRPDLTWEQVAEQLADEYGVSMRTVQRWLGRIRPPPHIRPRLMDDAGDGENTDGVNKESNL
jgi:hypothetical protein